MVRRVLDTNVSLKFVHVHARIYVDRTGVLWGEYIFRGFKHCVKKKLGGGESNHYWLPYCVVLAIVYVYCVCVCV